MKTRLLAVVGLVVVGIAEPCVTYGATSFAVGNRFSLDTRPASRPDPTAVDDETALAQPRALSLAVTPSPFNAETSFRFTLPASALVTLDIHDGLGQVIATPIAGEWLLAGTYAARWDSRDETGRNAASGVYTVVLRAGAEQRVQRAVLVR